MNKPDNRVKSLYIFIGIVVVFLIVGLTFFSPIGKHKAPKEDPILNLFRTVHIGNDRKISLRSKINELSDITRNIGNNFYSLKKGTFSVADSMAVEVNDVGQIMTIMCFYNYEPEFSNDTAFIHEQRKYRKIISGNDCEYNYSDKHQTIKVAKWLSANTMFEIVEAVVNGKKKIYSVIFDAQLYSEKYRVGSAHSWEISKRTEPK